jgi:hypothetical protein
MVHEWHLQTIERLKEHFNSDPDNLALIITGSVAREEAGEDSDVDFVLVASDDAFRKRKLECCLTINADEFAVMPGRHADGYSVDLPYLLDAVERADERTRFEYVKAQIVFSHIPQLQQVLDRISAYPEHERLEKMKSFYSQLPLHFSFMELAEYSQNAYLLAETAVQLVLFGGRLLLAYNRLLYPNRKWFMRELERAPRKPAGIIDLANHLLRQPGINNARAFCDSIENFTTWPQPEEGAWQRIHADSVWNWQSGGGSLGER